MIYTYNHVIDSIADIIVVPTTCDEHIPMDSLHASFVCLLEAEYMKRHFAAIRHARGNLIPGAPIVYYIREGDEAWVGRWIINFPVDDDMEFEEYMNGIRATLSIAKNMNAGEVAVQMPWRVPFSPEVQEMAWRWCEHSVLANVNCEVQLHTKDNPDGVKDDGPEEPVVEMVPEANMVEEIA